MAPALVAEDTVQIILLVLESKSRRFELLQLEFDRNALVQEILAQIPDAATEDVLRRQSYGGICSIGGTEMAPDTRLGDCIVRQNEVKIAIPLGLKPKECAEVAAPILGDEKVKAMLAEAAGEPDEVPVEKVREKKKVKKSKSKKSKDKDGSSSKKKRSKSSKASSVSSIGSAEVSLERKNSGRSGGPAAMSSSSRDINGGASANRVPFSSSQSAGKSSSSKNGNKTSLLQQLINIFFIPVDDSLTIGEYKVTHVTWFFAFLGFFISILCTEIHLTMPLRPGSIMRSGDFLRKCGYMGIFRGKIPFTCGPEMSAVLDEDSFLNVYSVPLLNFNDRKLLYRIVPENSAGMTDEGLYVMEDGTITLGGKSVVIEAASNETPNLTPWPFMNKVNLVRKRKNLIGQVIYKPV